MVLDEVLHANIFFIITSIATIIFCVLVSVILIYVIKILKKIRIIVDRLEAGSEAVANDVANIRAFMINGGLFSKVIQFFIKKGAQNKKKVSRKKIK